MSLNDELTSREQAKTKLDVNQERASWQMYGEVRVSQNNNHRCSLRLKEFLQRCQNIG